MPSIPPHLCAAFAADCERLDQRAARLDPAVPALAPLGAELASCAHAVQGTAALLGLEALASQARALETDAEAVEHERIAVQTALQRLSERQERLCAAWQHVSQAVRVALEDAQPVSVSAGGSAFTFVDEDDPTPVTAPTTFTFVDDDDSSPSITPVVTATVPSNADPFVAAFLAEATGLVERADALVSGLDALRPAPDALRQLMRIYHTLKGSAHTVGLSALGDALHDLEDRIEALRPAPGQHSSPLPTGTIAALAAVQDALRAGLHTTDPIRRERALVALAHARERLLPAMSTPPAASTTTRPLTVPLAAPAPAHVSSAAVYAPAASASETAAQDVRVPVQRLDHMLDLAGELVGARARLTTRLERLAHIERDLGRWRRRATPAIRRLIERSAHVAAHAPTSTNNDTGPDLERYDLATQLARRLEDHDDRLAGLAIDLRTLASEATRDAVQVGELAGRLHRDTAAVRLVEPGELVNRLHLAVKDAAHRLDRQVEFHVDTGGVLLDRALVDPLAQALVHVVRNAVDHGIRPAAERLAAGLPASGRITLSASSAGGAVTLQVSDDGPGLNEPAIRARAAALGLDDSVPVTALIFSPGFSTRSDADDVSGRGVGLDAAADAIARIGGRITASSGPGCTITIHLPPQVAVADLLLVHIGGRRCALPRSACARVSSPKDASDAIALAPALGLPATPVGTCLTLILPDRLLTVGVDRTLGLSEAVVQPPGRLIASLPLISGVVVPDDDLPIPVLDVHALAQRLVRSSAPLSTRASTPAIATTTSLRPRVLVADDSLAVRKVAERFLLDAGCDVVLAVDGADALTHLRSGARFHALISDLEMPQVDGYQLLQTLRSLAATRTLPVAIMSSRRDDQHRAEAHRLGADAYFTKPFTAAQLTAFVRAAGLARS